MIKKGDTMVNVRTGQKLSFQMGENAIVTSLTPPRKGHHLGKKISTTNNG
jgi:hypothetical protein